MPEYRNPQNEPGMDRNLLFVFLLMAVVIFGSQLLFKNKTPQQPTSSAHPTQQPIPAGTASTPARSEANSASESSGKKTSVSAGKKSVAPAQEPTKQASSESEIVIENDVYKITFTNRGAQVKSWILKKFTDDSEKKPLDLVNPSAASKYGFPLSLWTYDESVRARLNTALYVPSTTAQTLSVPGDLSFDYSGSGLAVRKTFHFDNSYVIGVDTSVFENGSPLWAFPAWPAGFGDQTNVPAYAAAQFEYQANNNVERVALKKVSGGDTRRGTYDWIGVTDTYFAAALIPDNPENIVTVSLRNAIELPGSDPNQPKPAEVLGVAAGSPGESKERVFAGPKSLQVLEAIHVPTILGAEKDLRGLVNFGSLGLIARPLFIWLRWTYQYVRNWGWAIVLQTILITIALLPLRITQMKSALKMQRVQPQMKAIQEKYKKYSMRDPRKQDMQREIQALYKEHGVNPFGGCLPLLVQLPFLWAYYRMLGAAIDLRQAHWLWIRDLSSPDPYYLLPLVMVVSMIFMQRMTPQPGVDPAQQRMMNITMPLVMGFIFFKLAAGLNLYYALSNLIMIAQQSIMNRTTLGREMREIAAKRTRKKDR